MNREEFEKYEGKRTTGRVSGCDLEGGRIIGYRIDTDDMELLAIDDANGWSAPSINDVVIPDGKDRKEYYDGKHKYLWVRRGNVCMDIDLTEILKGCEGVELWSDICGICKLKKIHYDYIRPIVIKSKYSKHLFLMKDGKYYTEGKCMLWPSETNRDWSTFVAPVKVKDGDWVVCGYDMTGFEIRKYFDTKSANFEYIIPYDKFRLDLTEEDLINLNINRE